MDDGGGDLLSDVSAVPGGAAPLPGGSEAHLDTRVRSLVQHLGEINLVIDDKVQRAPDTVMRNIGDLQSLLVDALARQSGVTVDLDT